MFFQHITLYCKELAKMEDFYLNTLKLEAESSGPGHATFCAGRSWLTLEQMPFDGPARYHFAFNISENLIRESAEWLRRQKIDVLPVDDSGNIIMEYPSWNAHAVYFEDPAGNIVEFIARHNLLSSKQKSFSINDIREISELGLPCDDVAAMAEKLEQEASIGHWSGDYDAFGASGDENGLFIIVDKSKKTWVPQDTPALPSPFVARLENHGRRYKVRYDGSDLDILGIHQVL